MYTTANGPWVIKRTVNTNCSHVLQLLTFFLTSHYHMAQSSLAQSHKSLFLIRRFKHKLSPDWQAWWACQMTSGPTSHSTRRGVRSAVVAHDDGDGGDGDGAVA